MNDHDHRHVGEDAEHAKLARGVVGKLLVQDRIELDDR